MLQLWKIKQSPSHLELVTKMRCVNHPRLPMYVSAFGSNVVACMGGCVTAESQQHRFDHN